MRPESRDEAGLVTFPIGALYYAKEAKNNGFVDVGNNEDRWKGELAATIEIGRKISRSEGLYDTKLTGIMHFNSALMRIDVGYERLLRYLTGYKGVSRKDLLSLALSSHGIEEATLRGWFTVRNEVNAMKHRNPEIFSRNRVTFDQMLSALFELVNLLEKHTKFCH